MRGSGIYLRHLAAQRDLESTDRGTLQDLGQQLVTPNPCAFLEGMLAWAGYRAGQDLVLEGLRHVSVLEALKAHGIECADPVVLIYIETPADLRARRLTERGETADRADNYGRHPVEQDTYVNLKAAADLTLSGDQPAKALCAMVMHYLSVR